MIKEQYVSVETAKLAKEKGYNELCCTIYKDGLLKIHKSHNGNNYSNLISNKGLSGKCFSAPTKLLLARWLREKYNVHVIPKPIYDSDRLEQYGCDIHCPDKNGLVFTIISHVFPVYKQTPNHNMTKELGTYEESMEAGLQEALKII